MKNTNDGDEVIITGGNAGPDDLHLLADVVATNDEELLRWLERRRQILARRARIRAGHPSRL